MDIKDAPWPFDDPPNAACFTTTEVLAGAEIMLVQRHYDADWQFLGAEDGDDIDSIKLVCLKAMVEIDQSISELHDLPYGWSADRPAASAPWRRFKDHPFPTFEEHGYYLEDAVWLSAYLKDIEPPDKRKRDNLAVGDLVKLVFRFADEEEARGDGQCERMWVMVTQVDEQRDCYVGKIDNPPHHSAARYGDTICFHPLHVAAIDG